MSSNSNDMHQRCSLSLGFALLAVLTATGCGLFSGTSDSACEIDCKDGAVCGQNGNKCIPNRLTQRQKTPNGHGLQALRTDSGLYRLSVDTEGNRVVAQFSDSESKKEWFELGEISSPDRPILALEETPNLVIAAWRSTTESRIQLAIHPKSSSLNRWYTDLSVSTDDSTTPYFDIAVDDRRLDILLFEPRDPSVHHYRTGFEITKRGLHLGETTKTDLEMSTVNCGLSGDLNFELGLRPSFLRQDSDRLFGAVYSPRCKWISLFEKSGNNGWHQTNLKPGKPIDETGDFLELLNTSAGATGLVFRSPNTQSVYLAYRSNTEQEFRLQKVDDGRSLDQRARVKKEVIGSFLDARISEDRKLRVAYLNSTRLNPVVATRSIPLRNGSQRDWRVERFPEKNYPRGFFTQLTEDTSGGLELHFIGIANGINPRIERFQLGGQRR